MQATATIKVLGIEVVQSIQNLRNEIPLLAGKETVVRVYVRPTDLPADMPVKGTLELRREGEQTSEAASEVDFVLRKQDIGGDDPAFVAGQRRVFERSLNFRLSPEQIRAGDVRICLKGVAPSLQGDPKAVIQGDDLGVTFVPGPTLRVRAVGLRVRDPQTGDVHAPKPGHFKSLKSYLERAFPVSRIEWSEITVDAAAGFEPPYSEGTVSMADPGPLWQKKFDIACAQIMAIRARDIDDGGVDLRTHYYGMVYHPDDFFVGAVSNVPDTPRPDIVGIGPAELEDGSYGAHELAHTLGRMHPGLCGGQRTEDPAFPASYHGKLSSADADSDHLHHGLDVGGGLERPQVLPSDEWYDLMTYCHPLWVSAYSYKGMLERLVEEEGTVKPPAKGGAGKYLQIVGTYNLDDNKGALSYVFPVRTLSLAPEGPERRVLVVGLDAGGKKLFESSVELKRAAATDLPHNSGAFQITVPAPDKLSKLELRVDGDLADSRSLGGAISAALSNGKGLDELSTFDKTAISVSPPVTSPDDPLLLKITWPKLYDRDLRHTVQARLPGQKWQTIAVDITDATTDVVLDRRLVYLPAPEGKRPASVDVQILRSSGFSETPIFEGTATVGLMQAKGESPDR